MANKKGTTYHKEGGKVNVGISTSTTTTERKKWNALAAYRNKGRTVMVREAMTFFMEHWNSPALQ